MSEDRRLRARSIEKDRDERSTNEDRQKDVDGEYCKRSKRKMVVKPTHEGTIRNRLTKIICNEI